MSKSTAYINSSERKVARLPNPTLIILMGASGTSKTVLGNVIVESHENAELVSHNKIYMNYEKLFASDTLSRKAWKEYCKRITRALKKHSYVVADSSNLTEEERSKFFKDVHIPNGTKIIGVWIESSLSAALKANSTKPIDERLPESVIKHMFSIKASPSSWEPFDDIIFLNVSQDMSISKSTQRIQTVINQLKAI